MTFKENGNYVSFIGTVLPQMAINSLFFRFINAQKKAQLIILKVIFMVFIDESKHN